MEFRELMDAFAADAGMTEPVAYEEGNACHLVINGQDYGFCDVPDAGRMVVWAAICARPPQSGEAFLVQLLRANFMNRGLPDGALSLSDDDIVCAHCSLKLPVFDKNEFYELLRRFVTAVDEWREMLELAERAREVMPQVRPEQPSGEGFLQV